MDRKTKLDLFHLLDALYLRLYVYVSVMQSVAFSINSLFQDLSASAGDAKPQMGKPTVSVLHNAQLLLNKQQQIAVALTFFEQYR